MSDSPTGWTAVLIGLMLISGIHCTKLDNGAPTPAHAHYADLPELETKQYRTDRRIVTIIPAVDLICTRPISPQTPGFGNTSGCFLYSPNQDYPTDP